MNKYPIYAQFWFSWLVFTAVYVIWLLLGSSGLPIKVGMLIGMFVPFGFWNAIQLIGSNPSAYIGPILLILLLLFTDKLSFKLGIESVWLKIVLNLVILFLLTALVDVLIWGHWISLESLVKGSDTSPVVNF
jgi:phosphoglycerol transferase MdoB-like AlkP superfamily enzyme